MAISLAIIIHAIAMYLMCVVLSFAWTTERRRPFVLFWAIGFGLMAVTWTIRALASVGAAPLFFEAWLDPLLFVTAFGFFAAGVSCRFTGDARFVLLAVWVATATGVVWGAELLRPGEAFGVNVAYLLTGPLAVMMAAAYLRQPKRFQNAPDVGLFSVLVFLGLLQIAVGLIAISYPADMRVAHAGVLMFGDLLAVPTLIWVSGMMLILAVFVEKARELQTISVTDFLSGALNRRGFLQSAQKRFASASNDGVCLSLVVADIDHFKRINDRYGHEAGDAAIKRFCDDCRIEARDTDLVGRMGGEEFAILLYDAKQSGGVSFAERVQRRVRSRPFWDAAPEESFCISFGVAEFCIGDGRIEDALSRADAALYKAKNAGRNQICVVRPPSGKGLDQRGEAAAPPVLELVSATA